MRAGALVAVLAWWFSFGYGNIGPFETKKECEDRLSSMQWSHILWKGTIRYSSGCWEAKDK